MKKIKHTKAFLARFRACDAGAVTVDFVVITAAIIGISIVVLASVSSGTLDLAGDVGETVSKFDMWGEASGPPRD